MSNIYYNPDQFDMKIVGEIDWSDGNYQFDLTVVWQRISDNVFLFGEDEGCSCPTPFDNMKITELRMATPMSEFKIHLDNSNINENQDRSMQIADLLERMHKLGAR